MHRAIATVIAASLLVIASCGDSDTPSTAATTSVGTTTRDAGSVTSTTSTTRTAATTSSTSAPTTSVATTRVDALVLRPDGIGSLRIGRDSANDVINGLTSLLGAANLDGPVACESGSDRTVRWTAIDLTVVFNKGVWAGYLYNAKRQPPLTTANGLTIGTSLGVLKAKYPSGLQIFTGSLGPEFSAPDGLRGFASGTTDSATITQLGAGDICAFR